MSDRQIDRRRILQLFGAGVAGQLLSANLARAESIPFVDPEVPVSRDDEMVFGRWFNKATSEFTSADWVLLHRAVRIGPFILVTRWPSYAGTIDKEMCTCVYGFDESKARWTISWKSGCPIHGKLTGDPEAPPSGVAITAEDEKRFRSWMVATNSMPDAHRLLLHLVPDFTRYVRDSHAEFGGIVYTKRNSGGNGHALETSACTCFYDETGSIIYQDRNCCYPYHGG